MQNWTRSRCLGASKIGGWNRSAVDTVRTKRATAWALIGCAVAAALSPAPCSLAAPPGSSVPAGAAYAVQVVLRFSDDPLFTRLYKEAVFSQARDQLLVLLEDVFSVEVVTQHVLADRLGEQPLEEFALSPTEAAELGISGQVFLVSVEFEGGTYRISSRRYDGPRGLLGPCRSMHTPDRQWVPKAVCDVVRRELVLEAEVRPKRGKPGEVYLRFPAALSRETIERWLPQGTVFQVLRVENLPNGGRRQTPIANTVLILQPSTAANHKGERPFTASVVSNLRDPWRTSSRSVRFVAVNLPVQQGGRLRLRLVDQATGEPAYGATIQVRVSDRGFDRMTDRDLLELNRDGYVTTPSLSGLAYVQVLQAGQVAFQFPVPILQEWMEMERRIPIDEQGREKAAFERLLDSQARDLRALHEQLNAAVSRINALNEAKRYEEARDGCAALLSEVRRSAKVATNRLKELVAAAQSLGLQDRPRLRQAADETAKLERRLEDLAGLQESLERTINNAEAQARADVLIELGRQAQDAFEIDDAIDKYKLALAEQPDQPELEKMLKDLQEAWRVKGSVHRQAREVVFGGWAKAEITELEEKLPEVRRAAQTLHRFKDNLGLERLVAANSDHMLALSDLVDELASRGATEDQQEADKWLKLVDTLEKFNEEVTGYLDGLEGSNSPAPADGVPDTNGTEAQAAAQDGSTADPARKSANGSRPSPSPLDSNEGEEEE